MCLVLKKKPLKTFISLIDDLPFGSFSAFPKLIEDCSLIDNLLFRFNIAADFCTHSFLGYDLVKFETTGNVKRDGKRAHADESEDKFWSLVCLDILFST